MGKRYVYLLSIDDHNYGEETYVYSNKKLGIEKYKETISDYLDENKYKDYSDKDKKELRKQKQEVFDDVDNNYSNDIFSFVTEREDYICLETKEIEYQ